MENKPFYTTSDLAKALGVSRITIFNKIKNGQIKAEKIGKNYVIRKEDVIEATNGFLTDKLKEEIKRGVDKVVDQYGEVLKKLGKE